MFRLQPRMGSAMLLLTIHVWGAKAALAGCLFFHALGFPTTECENANPACVPSVELAKPGSGCITASGPLYTRRNGQITFKVCCTDGQCLGSVRIMLHKGQDLLDQQIANFACVNAALPNDPLPVYSSCSPGSNDETGAFEVVQAGTCQIIPASIPTVSAWGLAVTTLVLLGAGTILVRTRNPYDGNDAGLRTVGKER